MVSERHSVLREQFWKRLPLDSLNEAEWEALCDGCGRCCLHKLQDEETKAVHYTAISCKLLDNDSCRCTDYANRLNVVAHCIDVRNGLQQGSLAFTDLPDTCAYRLLGEGKPLHSWHPLEASGSDIIHSDNISVRGKVLSETHVHQDDFQDHIIDWVEQ